MKDKVLALIQHLEDSIPYVEATLGAGNRFPSPTRPEWVEVHGGRAGSSVNQLKNILKEARALKKELE